MLISVVVFFFPLFFCSLTSTECLLPQHAVEAAIIYLGRERQTDDNSSVGEGHEAAKRGYKKEISNYMLPTETHFKYKGTKRLNVKT